MSLGVFEHTNVVVFVGVVVSSKPIDYTFFERTVEFTTACEYPLALAVLEVVHPIAGVYGVFTSFNSVTVSFANIPLSLVFSAINFDVSSLTMSIILLEFTLVVVSVRVEGVSLADSVVFSPVA